MYRIKVINFFLPILDERAEFANVKSDLFPEPKSPSISTPA